MRTEGGTGDSHAQTIGAIIKRGPRRGSHSTRANASGNLAAAPDDDSEQHQLE